MAAYKGDGDSRAQASDSAAEGSWRTAWPLLASVIALLACFASAWWSWQVVPAQAQVGEPWWRWWIKPYEQNAFARLPYVGVDVHGAAIAPNSDRHIVVGGNGLILVSDNNGDSWRAVTEIEWNAEAAPRRNRSSTARTMMLPLFAQAQAASRPDIYDGKPGPQDNSNALKQSPMQLKQQLQQEQQKTEPPQKPELLQNQESPPPSSKNAPAEEIIGPSVVDGPVDLFAVSFLNAMTGVAVGERGVILVTRDGGNSWSARHSGTGRNLNAVAFVGTASIIAVGDGGSVVISGDDGDSWQLQPAPLVVDLHGVAVTGGRSLLVVGDSGCVLRSQDGGASWIDQQWLNQRRTLHGIAVAQQTVVAVGAQGSVLHSSDGGASWKQIDTPIPLALHAAAIVDANHFVVAGENGNWLATADVGASWQPRDTGARGSWRQLLPQASGIFAVGQRGAIIANENGTSDNSALVPKVRGVDQQLRAAVTLKAAVLVAGGDTLLHSDSLGRRWNVLQGAAGTSLQAITRIDNNTAIAVGEQGVILRTEDGGEHWENKTGISLRPLLAVAASDNVVLAGGVDGTLLRSEDRGHSWRVSASGTGQALVALAFSNPATVMAATDRGALLRSINAGISWQNVDISSGAIAQFAFADTRNGIAVGAAGTVLRTSNGGKSWKAVDSGVEADLSDVLYIDALHVLAAGSDGVMIASSDGGTSWKSLAAWSQLSTRPVSALASPDAETVVVVARDGSIYYASFKDGEFDKLAFHAVKYRRYPAPASVAPLLVSLFFASIWRRRRQSARVSASGGSVADLLVTDRPLLPGDPDYMDFSRRAAQLSRFLRHERTEMPVTLAISAEWGRGKSSLMNLLAEDLAQNGYRPVWFNAWHHQKEGHLLASLLRSIQKQALPHVLTPSGFLLRVQLLSRRGVWYLIAAAFPVVIVLALVSYFGAYPERLAAVGPVARYVLNIEQQVTITAQTYAELEAIEKERSPMLKYWMPVLKSFRDARHVFADTDELVAAMRARANPSAPALSTELITTITQHAEHLRPVQRVFPELGNVWTGISAVIAAMVGAVTLVLNGMSVFGLRMPRGGSIDTVEKTGTRERFAADFSRLTQVLGKRLVIMIDDLDRCSRQSLMDMFEHINFLASEGQCAMVVAIAYDRVVKNLAVNLAADAGRSIENGPAQQDLDEAHFYLHKLIQLMVTIRPPHRNESQQMLTGRHGKTPKRPRKLWKRSIMTLWRHVQPWLIILGLAYLGVMAGSRGLALLSPQSTLPLLQQRLSMVQTPALTEATAPDAIEAAPPMPAANATDEAVVFREAAQIAFPWWLLSAAAIALLAAGVMMLLYREPQLRRVVSDRVRAALAVPVRERDSSEFLEALNLWHGVVADHLRSPRALKRFLNRLRFLTMGVVSSQASDGASEAHVVALAAIGIDNVDVEYDKLSPAQRALLDQHIAIFGRAPTEEERQLYLDLVGEMDRQALVSPLGDSPV
jgi:photosystem II stability/assembly factor-like uncharacterized protein